ncbi:MAG: hypothetical protein QXT80_04565 [Thermoplasmatales archaeon]
MAKVGFWLRGARGKLAGSVLVKSPHGTIVRENKTPANPKTHAQALQRAIFATVTKSAVDLAPVVESAFDGKKNGADSRREFVKLNIAQLRNVLNEAGEAILLPKGSTNQVPNYLILSNGSLGKISLTDSESPVSHNGCFANTTDGTTTFAQLKTAFPQIKGGSQLTFVWGKNVVSGDDSTFQWHYARIVLNPTIQPLDVVFNLADENIPASAIVTDKTEGFIVDELGNIDTRDVFGPADIDNVSYAAFAERECCGLIISEYDTDRGDWIHSQSIANGGDVFDPSEAIASYMSAAKVAGTSDYYTEQAEPEYEGDLSYDSLNEAISGTIRSAGYAAKTLNLESSNSYGPIPEGNYVDIQLNCAQGVSIPLNSIQVLLGETAAASLQVRKLSFGSNNAYLISFPVPFGTAQSVQANITLDVNVPQGTWENSGFRVSIAKVQG